jgi:hypothetical protein
MYIMMNSMILGKLRDENRPKILQQHSGSRLRWPLVCLSCAAAYIFVLVLLVYTAVPKTQDEWLGHVVVSSCCCLT